MEPLDNWVWRALTGAQQAFAEGEPPAVRYQPDVAVFAALPDVITPDAWHALGELVGPDGMAVLIRAEIGPIPDGWKTVGIGVGLQMIGPAPGSPRPAAAPVPAGIDLVTLGPDDVADMLELIAITGPGPFETRTIELGTYVGARSEGRLVAIAGERVRFEGYTEISAVCTHPDHRGQGLAGALLDLVIDEIHSRDDVPILHVLSTNEVAISRYASLGFTGRIEARVAFVTQSPTTAAALQAEFGQPTESTG